MTTEGRLSEIERRLSELEKPVDVLRSHDPGGVTLVGEGGQETFIPYEDLASRGLSELDPRTPQSVSGSSSSGHSAVSGLPEIHPREDREFR